MVQPVVLAVAAPMRALLMLLALVMALAVRPARADFASYAVVLEDASLLIRGKVVHLYGIYIPDNRQFCQSTIRPPSCGNRAAVALDQKISKFVRCEPIVEYDDGSIGAQCWTNYSKFSTGEDLAAYLIFHGFAMAGPDAPFEYIALERLAAANGRGVWGFQADQVSNVPRRQGLFRHR
ncbi:nuclease-like protein [Defluviicoccus vanus]|uniref:Nuclease-like protein n=1 Tax=Defluviicoccus vanus TaxID=111831 RepID=A0A7H1N3R3_9PROT|nr:nuclease-like protein [Defluviicoccus vanus]